MTYAWSKTAMIDKPLAAFAILSAAAVCSLAQERDRASTRVSESTSCPPDTLRCSRCETVLTGGNCRNLVHIDLEEPCRGLPRYVLFLIIRQFEFAQKLDIRSHPNEWPVASI